MLCNRTDTISEIHYQNNGFKTETNTISKRQNKLWMPATSTRSNQDQKRNKSIKTTEYSKWVPVEFPNQRPERIKVWPVTGILCPADVDHVSQLVTWAVKGFQVGAEQSPVRGRISHLHVDF